MSNFDWSSLIEIEASWYTNQLNKHFLEVDGKVSVMVHTVRATGTTILSDGLVTELHNMLPEYVYGKTKVEKMGIKKAALTANRFFGEKDPDTDGKYGELLLFALVETVLKCKMVAHKIRSLSNMRDQVKGGDGLFIGDYTLPDKRKYPAYLVGESKVVNGFAVGLDEAFKSLNRFHDDIKAPEFRSTELIVAKENLIQDDRIDLNELYERLNIESETFKKQILVHPVLIMFDTEKIKRAEKKATTPDELEEEIKKFVESAKGKTATSIAKRLKQYPEIEKVFLHFFLIPFNDVDKFRNSMYYAIHGKTYGS